jgi:hypothetical protein
MENLFFFVIIIITIVAICYIDDLNNAQTKLKIMENKENFNSNSNSCSTTDYSDGDILSLDPYHRCKVLGVNKFMIRDLKTKLWLTDGLEEGFSKFLPGRFGVLLMMSDKPDEYLPLRTVADPNDYLLATYNGSGIRVVSNPYNQTFVLQVFIYNGHNVIGYINESSTQLYLVVDSNGNITSTKEPSKASIIEILEV